MVDSESIYQEDDPNLPTLVSPTDELDHEDILHGGKMTRGRAKRHGVQKMRGKGSSTSSVQVDTQDNVNLNMENPFNDAPPMENPPTDSPMMNHPPTTDFEKMHQRRELKPMPSITLMNLPQLKKERVEGAIVAKYTWGEGLDKVVEKIWHTKCGRGLRDAVCRAKKYGCEKAGIDPYDPNADWSKVKSCRHKDCFIPQGKKMEYPSQLDFFKKTHQRKNGGAFVDEKSNYVSDKYNSSFKEKHGDESYTQVQFDPKAWTDAIGKRSRSHLYRFGSLEAALSNILPGMLSNILTGMLASMSNSPNVNQSGDNVVLPSPQHDSEATESEDGNDGENGDYMNMG
ncbi:Transposase, Ptta/En/Spm, plant [Corchorus capsularis]|uniref:Transposase, Ptta/En/Spm, plant n=1 Tax=Corchorus capsularis TaxID=210143 RepID=A0A1R3IZW1_COCAP|nr:Transposase, Ptta/En/Spm, plant [Corchorus capsularis]